MHVLCRPCRPCPCRACPSAVVHAHAAHTQVVHTHVRHAHAVQAYAMNSIFYIRINRDMPTVAIGAKLFYSGMPTDVIVQYYSEIWHVTIN